MTTVFGNGADTASYKDFEETDLIIAWGSNAQEAHPIIWNHMRRGMKNGAKFVCIDPRRTTMSKSAQYFLPVNAGTDIALANAMAYTLIEEDLYDKHFVDSVTTAFEDYKKCVSAYKPEDVAELTGIPAETIREVARLYATSPRAMLAWTLGITEHHNGVDNVYALINLGILTGHVGKFGSGLMPLRGQNNVQGGGDMGALPNRIPGFKNVTDDAARERLEKIWNCKIPTQKGLHLSEMFEAAAEGQIRSFYIIGENPAQSDANSHHVTDILKSMDFIVVQDLFLTKTAELADVVLPAAGWGECDGTYTNSERGVQRVRKLVQPAGEARSDIEILQDVANKMGGNWNYQSAEDVWNELREISPSHYGMSYERLEKEYELAWPCPTLDDPGARLLHEDLHQPDCDRKVPFMPVEYDPPVEPVDEEYPIILNTGRRLAFYNTGVMTNDYGPKVKGQEEVLEMNAEDADRLGIEDDEVVRISSRRGSLLVKAKRVDRQLPGTAWMSFHWPDKVNTNILVNDAYDKKSGIAPYKYTAVKIEKASPEDQQKGAD